MTGAASRFGAWACAQAQAVAAASMAMWTSSFMIVSPAQPVEPGAWLMVSL
ncbi:hypothetical protein RugamoR64_61380 [Duganella rhizosphaerae]